jgi:hypothetical protein
VTTISSTADLLRLLREDPDFRDEVRRLLLTQELIELPERFARFVTYAEQQFTEMRGDITRIDGSITEMQGSIQRIDGEVIVIRGAVGGLQGAEYERKVSRSFASYASMAFSRRHNRRLRRNRLLHSSGQGMEREFEELLSNALDNGLITDAEALDMELADAVMRGEDNDGPVYFVGEISITVNNDDIERAVIRAGILNKATGSIAWPMVIGETIAEPQRARVGFEQVEVRSVRQ